MMTTYNPYRAQPIHDLPRPECITGNMMILRNEAWMRNIAGLFAVKVVHALQYELYKLNGKAFANPDSSEIWRTVI